MHRIVALAKGVPRAGHPALDLGLIFIWLVSNERGRFGQEDGTFRLAVAGLAGIWYTVGL